MNDKYIVESIGRRVRRTKNQLPELVFVPMKTRLVTGDPEKLRAIAREATISACRNSYERGC